MIVDLDSSVSAQIFEILGKHPKSGLCLSASANSVSFWVEESPRCFHAQFIASKLMIYLFCFIYESNAQCIQDDALVASPPPMSDPFTGGNPTYFPGQIVEFCYTVESYNGASADNNNNWMFLISDIIFGISSLFKSFFS